MIGARGPVDNSERLSTAFRKSSSGVQCIPPEQECVEIGYKRIAEEAMDATPPQGDEPMDNRPTNADITAQLHATVKALKEQEAKRHVSTTPPCLPGVEQTDRITDNDREAVKLAQAVKNLHRKLDDAFDHSERGTYYRFASGDDRYLFLADDECLFAYSEVQKAWVGIEIDGKRRNK